MDTPTDAAAPAAVPTSEQLCVVFSVNGPDYDYSRGRRQQDGWDDHAAFMDDLTERGLVALGGPLGHGGGEAERAMLVVRASSDGEVRRMFASDPWLVSGILELSEIQPWTVWLGEICTRARRQRLSRLPQLQQTNLAKRSCGRPPIIGR